MEEIKCENDIVNEEIQSVPAIEENPSDDVHSIEINLNVIKTFFLNTISLYEQLIKICCKECNIISSPEFVNLHKILNEFDDNIFKVFDVTLNKSLFTNLCKKVTIQEKNSEERIERPIRVRANRKSKKRYNCFVKTCDLYYSTEEGAKVHFIKSHCFTGDVFQVFREANTQIDFSLLKTDEDGRYLCDVEDCQYASNDRSNFKVHYNRHSDAHRFVCICSKKFYNRDPLITHFVRLHMKNVDFKFAETDIKELRKTIRRLTNREYCSLKSNDELPDSYSDNIEPCSEDTDELNSFISQAISDSLIAPINEPNNAVEELNNNLSDNEDDQQKDVNSFQVSLNLKDRLFTDSVTFRTEGVDEKKINNLMKKTTDETPTIKMTLNETKDKVVKKEIPQRRRKYKCPHKFCSQDFFTIKNLLVHVKASHDPNNPIECKEPGCFARFKTSALLAQHQRRHQVQYSCSICSYKTHLAALMTRHNRQHAGQHLHHECSVCHEKFEYLGSLRTHLQKVHNEIEALKCEWPDCNKKFKTIIGLKKHAREFHCNMKVELACDWPDCSSVFSNKSALNNHMRIHTNERPYQCEWQDCGKWFRLKETLNRHRRLHQGYKPHVCPFANCDWSFTTKRNLKQHIEKGHGKSNSSSKLNIKKVEENEVEEPIEETQVL